VRPPKELGEARFRSRRELLTKLLANEPVYQHGSDFSASRWSGRWTRLTLLRSPSAKAFDLSLEPRTLTPTTPAASGGCLLSGV
jgi:hypothetical protein